MSGVTPTNQTKERPVHELFAGHSGTKVECESCLFSQGEKHQNSQKWAKFMNFLFCPFLWFGLPGRLLIVATNLKMTGRNFWAKNWVKNWARFWTNFLGIFVLHWLCRTTHQNFSPNSSQFITPCLGTAPVTAISKFHLRELLGLGVPKKYIFRSSSLNSCMDRYIAGKNLEGNRLILYYFKSCKNRSILFKNYITGKILPWK